MNLVTELNELLVETFNVIQKGEEKSLRSPDTADLSIREFHILEAIAKNNGTNTVSGLAAYLGITLPSVTIAIKKLESKGYIQKIKSYEDARSVHIELTEKGIKTDCYHQNFHRHMISQVTEQLNENEKEVLYKAVLRLNKYFRIIIK